MKELSDFQVACVVIAIPLNSILFIFSCFGVIALVIEQNWNFVYFVLSACYAGLNLVASMSATK